MKETISLIIILLSLIMICVYITSKIETFYNEEVNEGIKKMKDGTHTDLTDQDTFVECPNGADFKQIADSYVQCCKLDSNKAICEHPTFKKCKEDYLKVAKDTEYIKYLGNEETYNMAKLQFRECINTMNDSFSNYKDVSYKAAKDSKNYMVNDLHSLSNKSNTPETCKNMCNIWKTECKGYKTNDSDCMLYSSIKDFMGQGVSTDGKMVKGNDLKIKN